MRLSLMGACSAFLLYGASLSAQAAFVIQGGSTQDLPITDNKFNTELAGLGFDQMTSGAQLRVSQDGFVDLYFIGAESKFNNSFTAQGEALSGNNKSFLTEHNEDFNFEGHGGFTIAVSASDILKFSFTSDDVAALKPVDNFNGSNLQGLGIYFNTDQSGALEQVLLGYDDQTVNPDKDFEDMLIRVDFRPGFSGFEAEGVSAVPLPAAAWLFGAGLIALTGFAKRESVQK